MEKMLEDIDSLSDESDLRKNSNLEYRGSDHYQGKNDDGCSLDLSEDKKRDQHSEFLFNFFLLTTAFFDCKSGNIISLNVSKVL